MKPKAILVGGIVVVGLVLYVFLGMPGGHDDISVDTAFKMIQRDSSVIVLDVRTPAEYESETGHLANAILIPVQQLEERLHELEPYKERTIIAYCRTGNRSGRAATLLNKHGFNTLNMDGGITAWNNDRLPVVKEEEE